METPYVFLQNSWVSTCNGAKTFYSPAGRQIGDVEALFFESTQSAITFYAGFVQKYYGGTAVALRLVTAENIGTASSSQSICYVTSQWAISFGFLRIRTASPNVPFTLDKEYSVGRYSSGIVGSGTRYASFSMDTGRKTDFGAIFLWSDSTSCSFEAANTSSYISYTTTADSHRMSLGYGRPIVDGSRSLYIAANLYTIMEYGWGAIRAYHPYENNAILPTVKDTFFVPNFTIYEAEVGEWLLEKNADISLELLSSTNVTGAAWFVGDDREFDIPPFASTVCAEFVQRKASVDSFASFISSILTLTVTKSAAFPCPDISYTSILFAANRKGYEFVPSWPLAAEFLASWVTARAGITDVFHSLVVDHVAPKGSGLSFELPHVATLDLEYEVFVSGWVLQNFSALQSAGFKGANPIAAWAALGLVGGHFRKGALASNNFDTNLLLDINLSKATIQEFFWVLDHEFLADGLASRLFDFGIELVFDAQIGRYKFVPFRKKLFLKAVKNEHGMKCSIPKG